MRDRKNMDLINLLGLKKRFKEYKIGNDEDTVYEQNSAIRALCKIFNEDYKTIVDIFAWAEKRVQANSTATNIQNAMDKISKDKNLNKNVYYYTLKRFKSFYEFIKEDKDFQNGTYIICLYKDHLVYCIPYINGIVYDYKFDGYNDILKQDILIVFSLEEEK
jgi:hypothetical protein